MNRVRCLVLAAMAVLGLSAIAVPAAQAEPELLNSKGKEVAIKGFSSKDGEVELAIPADEERVICKEGVGEGKVKNTKEVGGVSFKWTHCKGESPYFSSNKCEVHSVSPKGGSEEIVTNRLKGRLVSLVKPIEENPPEKVEAGLLLEPEEKLPLLEATGSCLPISTIKVSGGVVGYAEPFRKLASIITFHYSKECPTGGTCPPDEHQKIEEFGKKERAVLEVSSLKALLVINDTVTFGEEAEVT